MEKLKNLAVISVLLLMTFNFDPQGQGQCVRAQGISGGNVGLGPDTNPIPTVTDTDADSGPLSDNQGQGPPRIPAMSQDAPMPPAQDMPPKVLHKQEAHYDFTGVQDVVFLLDRSGSVGYYEMELHGKAFMESLLRTAYVINPAYTRLAVVTFSGTATTVVDSITGQPVSGCELFAKNGLWEGIKYEADDQDGANYKTALDLARSILSAGRLMRAGGHPQALWLVSDGEHGSQDVSLWTSYVKDDGVDVYGAGMGGHLDETRMRNVVSSPTEYYYRSTEQWVEVLKGDMMQSRNVTDGLYEKVGMNLCGTCGSGATCYCDTLSDRQPLCACNQHFYPQGNECLECPSGSHKSVWGNQTCSDCLDQTSLVGGVTPDRCTSGLSLVLIITLSVGGAALIVLTSVCIVCLCRRHRRQRHGSDSSDGESPNTIYTQTYSTPESARALVGSNRTQKILTGRSNTAFYPPLTPQTSNLSTDSGVSMSTNPHYADPSPSSHNNNVNSLASVQATNKKRRNKKNNMAVQSECISHDYIDVVEGSASDSDHEDPQTIANLSLKYRGGETGRAGGEGGGLRGGGGRVPRGEQAPRRGQPVNAGAVGKPRMPSPSRDAGNYENATEVNRFKRFKNRLSRTFGLSNDYSNAEEINKLKKDGGRASEKITAYQVKNMIDMFEKADAKQAVKKTRTLPGNMPSSFQPEVAAAAGSGLSANGVVLRVHNNLAASRSNPVGGRSGASAGGRTLPGKLLNTAVPRPQSTHSMDSDGYMKPVIDPNSHASYIDLIPDHNLTPFDNDIQDAGSPSQDEDLYEIAVPNSKC